MFYDTQSNSHGLAHDPFKAIVAPRPIGWIGTRAANGINNLAPYSFFNAVGDNPKLVMFASSGRKDSLRNIEETGVFTVSFVSRALLSAMNASSAAVPPDVDEFRLSGLDAGQASLVDAPYVAQAAAALECRSTLITTLQDVEGKPTDSHLVVGQVVGIHIEERVIRNGRFDLALADPIMRLGYRDYAGIDALFELERPLAVQSS